MKRFLSTTAVILALTGGAYAQSTAEVNTNMGAVEFEQGDFYASNLIGMRIYNAEQGVDADQPVAAGAEAEWDDIGEINDIIVAQDGSVRAVILGVGGFLGLGERDVAVSMDDITVVRQDGDMNDRFLVVSTSKEALEALPEFDRNMGDETLNGETLEQNAEATAQDAENMAENAAEATEQTAEDAGAAVATTADNMQDEMTRPAYEREGYQNAEMAEVEKLTAEEINGSYVYGSNDETVGEIDNLMVGDDGKLTEAVINVGGFLGIGEKPVLVSFDDIQVLKSEDGSDYRFYINSTKEQLEQMPEYQD
ncbi:PRC-barrel domain-containing protein [Sulfitobacter sp. G21635-S1]|uniref:PRC-barrel domain-containing protein n=1 Tax=Sulfitobacter sp. G21635-S1 TaxID=3014043 RepID=UPI0022B060F2|nr:PRC-barrel domain-containing protein [Sulfitobacter sp. G21635-S1]MCZ4255125.1 PRC-barrel domain-containing protein [Sulfitobacter sp. G21635-S1]